MPEARLQVQHDRLAFGGEGGAGQAVAGFGFRLPPCQPPVEILPDFGFPVDVAAGLPALAERIGQGVLTLLLGVERANIGLAPAFTRTAGWLQSGHHAAQEAPQP